MELRDKSKIWEHLRAVLKHWIWLMSGIASVILSLVERVRGFGVPGWIFWIVSGVCFCVAFHLAWLEKQKALTEKDKELQAALGPAPEIVLEYVSSKRNPLMLRNLRGWTAYHVKIEDVVIADRCTATFEEVSHLAEGASVGVLPFVQDRFVKPDSDEWKSIKDDFLHALECAYQTWGHDFSHVHLKIFVDYADRNGRKYQTECKVDFDRFKMIAMVKCEPPKPVTQSGKL